MRKTQTGRQGEGVGRKQAHKERKTGTVLKEADTKKWVQSHTKTAISGREQAMRNKGTR